MAYPSEETLNLARRLTSSLAGRDLPPQFARLYSQHTRLRERQPGLPSWKNEESYERLDDAVRLIEASFIEREAGRTEWRNGLRRAGELLEWLSHPELTFNELPTRLLSAAAYQLAGYPARSSGLLSLASTSDGESEIIKAFLRTDFTSLLVHLSQFWSYLVQLEIERQGNTNNEGFPVANDFNLWIISETASALGILCANLRWGDEGARLEKALEKLKDISGALLGSDNPYSWLLAKLCAAVGSIYMETSLRANIRPISEALTENGQIALERYVRQSYRSGKALVWPSQILGIRKLLNNESFVLSTPTGSGKTAIAELAILQSLFREALQTPEGTSSSNEPMIPPVPLALYLVPSRALATEVESKLSRVLRAFGEEPVITGLYGGTDWGPTDAWLTSDKRTVLICTYEKAEALVRFLGPLFLSRVNLIVIDEAHNIQFDQNTQTLRSAESRPLRLESIGTRIFAYLQNSQCRIIALSAVAAGAEQALAHWVTNDPNVEPTKIQYRSTRQLIGRLQCLPNRKYVIYYDLLDGADLRFEEDNQGRRPYVNEPFPPCPLATAWENSVTIGKRLRPQLFWAAMHLASPDDTGQQRAVLVSITERIEGYAEDLLKLLESTWNNQVLPQFFTPPNSPGDVRLWEKCLAACADYYTTASREFKLLSRGIVVHHGKMPGLMARSLVEVIEARIVHLVLATSTLSEGVNLPFETVLVPSLERYGGELNAREFGNLVGRAGRPGYGTEGRSLVLMEPASQAQGTSAIAKNVRQVRSKYSRLIGELRTSANQERRPEAASPLASLLKYIQGQWQKLTRSTDLREFYNWLEVTAPLEVSDETYNSDSTGAFEALDTLDSILLAAIVELEELVGRELSGHELEDRLKLIWARTYAKFASIEQMRLEQMFIMRGTSITTTIYSSAQERRRLYRTTLPARSGNRLLELYPKVRSHLATGRDYAVWDAKSRFDFIRATAEMFKGIPKFGLTEPPSNQAGWEERLHWWLDPTGARQSPTKTQIAAWHKYIAQNFNYRFNWGLGSFIALALDETNHGTLRETSLERWSDTGLPWIVFWLKELIIWGTLDPVVAHLLSHGLAFTRGEAEEIAKVYYGELESLDTPNDALNASKIRNWCSKQGSAGELTFQLPATAAFEVQLIRNFDKSSKNLWRVIPVEVANEILWLDPGGFSFARSTKPSSWQPSLLSTHDFTLDVSNSTVSSSPYM